MSVCRALLVGESWVTHSIHQKGFDSFTTTDYVEGGGALIAALRAHDIEVDYLPAHVAMREFPDTASALQAWDCIIISDIGANSFLLHPDTFNRSVPRPDRLEAIKSYVQGGGGVVMVGGYLTFQGIEAKGCWRGTPVEAVLPVTLEPYDDRCERPAGVVPVPVAAHPVLDRIDGSWPALLGYNRLRPRPAAQVLATVGDDPLLVVGTAGAGRSVAFASDCSPHWAPPAFMDWEHYPRLWSQMVIWAAGTRAG